MKKFGSLVLGIFLLSPFAVNAQTVSSSTKAQLIATLYALVAKLEAEIQSIIAAQVQLASQQQQIQNTQATQSQQIQQVVQNTTPVFGSTQATSSGTITPTCSLTASSTPIKGETIAWSSTNANSGTLYITSGAVDGGVRIYKSSPTFDLLPVTSGYEDDFGPNWYYKAVFTSQSGDSVTCLADVTESPYWISQHGN